MNTTLTSPWSPIVTSTENPAGCEQCRAERLGNRLTETELVSGLLDQHRRDATRPPACFADYVRELLAAERR